MSDLKPQAHYLSYDLETGGLSFKRNGILTAYFATVSSDFTVIDELNLKIRPDLTKYTVEEEALNITKINIEKHMSDPDSLSYEDASKKILEFISNHKPKGRSKLKPLGQNIFFDDMFLFFQLLDQGVWEKSVHYSRIDTKVCCDLLKEAGMLPGEIGTLRSMVDHFGVAVRTAHEARSDVLMTIDVYAKLNEMLRNLSKNTSALNGDILSLIER